MTVLEIPEEISTEDDEDYYLTISHDEIELFYCKAWDKHVAVPPGSTELILETIPRFSCYNCREPCHFQQANQVYLTNLIERILNSRNGYRRDFIDRLDQYRIIPTFR